MLTLLHTKWPLGFKGYKVLFPLLLLYSIPSLAYSVTICQSPNKISTSCWLFPYRRVQGSKQSGDLTHFWTPLSCNLLKPQEDQFMTVVSQCASLWSQNYSWVLHGASTKTGVSLQTPRQFWQRALRHAERCGTLGTVGGENKRLLVSLDGRSLKGYTDLYRA